MANKKPATLSAMLTIVLLVIIAILSLFFEMITLNGATEKQATIALGLGLACNGVGVVLFGLLSSWLAKLAMTKFKWSTFLAVGFAVALTVIAGSIVSFLDIIISILFAGIK